MSIVKLSGGLGNQLFQVALAISIAKSTGKSVGLDATNYRVLRRNSDRQIQIGGFKKDDFYFCDSTSLLTRLAHFFLCHKSYLRFSRLKNQIERNQSSCFGLPIQQERNLNFDSAININSGSYYSGSFISPEYWGEYRDEVLSEIRQLMAEYFGFSVSDEIPDLTIHIRRGDYLSNEKARKFHGICSLDYYLASTASMLREFSEIKKIQIFSDENRFAEELRSLLRETGLSVEINPTVNPPEALVEMSVTKYFIGCNSSFSWWATALNKNRISVLPSQWYLDPLRATVSPNFYEPKVRIFPTTLE